MAYHLLPRIISQLSKIVIRPPPGFVDGQLYSALQKQRAIRRWPMNARTYTGTVISELIALIEKRICIVPDCDHLGQPCAKCKEHVCKIHSEKCTDCSQIHCKHSPPFHSIYSQKPNE